VYKPECVIVPIRVRGDACGDKECEQIEVSEKQMIGVTGGDGRAWLGIIRFRGKF